MQSYLKNVTALVLLTVKIANGILSVWRQLLIVDHQAIL